MEYKIRKASRKDDASVRTLFFEMLCFLYGEEKAKTHPCGGFERFYSGGEDVMYLAEADGRTIAFLSVEVHREEKEFVYYDDFCVTQAHRGWGVGGRLLEEGEKYRRSLGLLASVLHVEKTNESARRFYAKRGFRVLREDGTRLCLIKETDDE